MEKSLQAVLNALDGTLIQAGTRWEQWKQIPVSRLIFDSRRAAPHTVFFCLKGKTSDGHIFATSAYHSGCRFFVVERDVSLPEDAVIFRVSDTRKALADCAAAFYDHPERSMQLIGLTGTKGKTTTALLIKQLLDAAAIPTGYIGTNGVIYGNYRHDTLNSTPESVEIYRHLRDMLDAGIKVCVLEVSSQALWMGRVRGLTFDTVLFTNLSRDHIGGVEHPDFDHYRACKKLLFTDYPTEAAVFHTGDPAWNFMAEGVCVPILTCSTRGDALWSAQAISPARVGGRIGVVFQALRGGCAVGDKWFLPLPGEYNVQNALAALCVVCERFGIPPLRAQELLAAVTVAGRFETVTHPSLPDVTFIIDYAHNGVSLAAVLDALRQYGPKRLICLFGSVGGRTKERRRDLAEAAARRCDLCVLTADNPGTEPVMDIIREIDSHFPVGGCLRIHEPNREEAIRRLVREAQAGDVILLAGKGHEDYQLIGPHRVPFSERQILLDALEELAAAAVMG